MYIEDQEALEAFVERARRSSVLAIDTEFLREKTYYARLCLIQFATDDEVAVVDPFCMEDLHVLAPLLEDAGVMKVLHSGGQDLEILWHEVGVLPQPAHSAATKQSESKSARSFFITIPRFLADGVNVFIVARRQRKTRCRCNRERTFFDKIG